MKKRKSDESGSILTITMHILLAIFVLCFILYSMTYFMPFMLLGIITLLGVSANAVLMVIVPVQYEEDSDRQSPQNEEEDVHKGFKGKIKGFFLTLGDFITRVYEKKYRIIRLISFAICFIICQISFIFVLKQDSVEKLLKSMEYWHILLLLAIFICEIILEKGCRHCNPGTDQKKAIARNLYTYLHILKVVTGLCLVTAVAQKTGLYDGEQYMIYAASAVFYYCSVMIIISIAVLEIRKEADVKPYIVIPFPFSESNKDKETQDQFSILGFLESNTKISMRSLWSIRYVKTLIPIAILGGALLLWISTGIIQVESDQRGAVYRFGRLTDEILSPGLHMTLPYPLDKVEIYNTERVERVTVGYISGNVEDNYWTEFHGYNEDRLLLGNGDELASVNLRIEYKIGDLKEYLVNTADPVEILQAHAYELITQKTISTDLAGLLTIDRTAFAKEFQQDLSENISRHNTGIEIVCVVLESIHPPVEVAAVYQNLISAEIRAVQILLEAEAEANVTKAEAEKYYDSIISEAVKEDSSKTAEAYSSVAEFMAGVEMYKEDRSAYMYYKYLKAVAEAYGKVDLVIVGEGIDTGNIFIGNIVDIFL